MAKTPTGSRTGKVAGPSRSRLLRVSRSADEYPCTQRVPSPRHGPMATLAQAAKPTGPDHLGTDSEAGGRLPPETPHPSSLAFRAVCRHSPEVGAECLNGARSDLCGGHSAMSVPTAIIRSGDGFGLHDLRLIERPHVHVAFGGPCGAGDVAQPRGCQVEARLAVRECSDDTGSAANFFMIRSSGLLVRIFCQGMSGKA